MKDGGKECRLWQTWYNRPTFIDHREHLYPLVRALEQPLDPDSGDPISGIFERIAVFLICLAIPLFSTLWPHAPFEAH
jgi:hypothetical protein